MLDRDDRLLLLGSLVPARGMIDAVKNELASFMPRTSALLAEVARDLDDFATEFVGEPDDQPLFSDFQLAALRRVRINSQTGEITASRPPLGDYAQGGTDA